MSKKKNMSPENENIEVDETIDVQASENINEITPDSDSAEPEKKAPTIIMPTKGVHVDEAEKEAYLESVRKAKKRKKIIATVIVVAVVLLFAFIIYSIAFGGNGNDVEFSDKFLTKSEPLPSKGQLDDSGSICISGDYGFSFDKKTNLMSIRKGSVTLFRSYPAALSDEAEPGGLKFIRNNDLITSPVLVGYTKSGIDGGSLLGINQIPHESVYNLVDADNNGKVDGLQIKYTLTEVECSFYIEFILTEKGSLDVRIPSKGISEKPVGPDDDPSRMPRLASITVLPFMCASRQGDNGYFVTPDGSGALTYFDVARVPSNTEYAKRVYGYDDLFDKFELPDYNNQDISIPAFGSVNNILNANGRIDHKLTTAFATVGDSENKTGNASAQIIMNKPATAGDGLQFYYIAYRFNLREYYYDSISKNGDPFKFLEEDLSVGDMREEIFFDVRTEKSEDRNPDLSKNSFTYVDVAKKTREFLKETWNIDKKIESSDEDLMNLKILVGSENIQSTSMFGQVKVMTTFSDVKDIYSTLSENGVNNVKISLLGWQSNGYFGNVTDKFDIESDFGGEDGLEELLKWASENNLNISADNNLLELYAEPAFGISMKESLVKEPGTDYYIFKAVNPAGVYVPGTGFYYVSPSFFNDELLEEDIEGLKELGFANVDLQQVGDLVFTDYNPENALLRQQAIAYYSEWIQKYKEAFEDVAVYYGYDYAVKHADKILDIPTESSNLFFIDEAIPFVQIVYHGMIDFYCEPINRKDHPDSARLKAIEYGCLLSYEITKENPEELKYTLYNDLFKSEFESDDEEVKSLRDDIIAAYKVAEELNAIRTATITNHYCVDVGTSENNIHGGNVYCTEYDNGYKVYVNYGSSDYTVGNDVVESMQHKLVPPTKGGNANG